MDNQTTIFVFDTRIHRLVAIKKAAYRFGGGFQVQLDTDSEFTVRVTLTPKSSGRDTRLSADGFSAEVLDQELREVVAAETAGIRDVILAQAFSGLALTDAQGECAEYREDPLQIEVAESRLHHPIAE